LLGWNILFTLALTGTILAHTVRFPADPSAPLAVVGTPAWYQQIPLLLLLLTFPVLYFDFALFSGLIVQVSPAPRRLAPGFLLGAFVLVAAVFMVIFTNVWGYVEPVSTPFRNQFWLPHFLLAGGITLLILVLTRRVILPGFHSPGKSSAGWIGVFLGVILIATAAAALLTDRTTASPMNGNTLKVMTYNIQQANDAFGEKSYERQLELIRQVDPDILGLQESDSARVSLNNNDIVRYFASRLGYHAYYGPKTVTGTYGSALLSKYPLENATSFFSYSDQDEIGSVQADIRIGDERVTVFNVHPAGSDTAMIAFADALLSRAADSTRVISIGDYNLRESEEAYQRIDAAYKNAWMDVYPTGIGADGTDMSGDRRIDHIFVSPEMTVSDPVYLLAPASQTDHPAHWATISW
jgi:endonuclease/exonuclease/phosphatase family metal-dependent hydrolase